MLTRLPHWPELLLEVSRTLGNQQSKRIVQLQTMFKNVSFYFVFCCVCVSVGSATVISPLELIRTKLQAEKQSYRQVTDCIRSAVQTEGWRSLWRGFGPTLLRDVPFSAMYWHNYEKGKIWLCERYKTREPTFAITFTSGAVSGSVSASV